MSPIGALGRKSFSFPALPEAFSFLIAGSYASRQFKCGAALINLSAKLTIIGVSSQTPPVSALVRDKGTR